MSYSEDQFKNHIRELTKVSERDPDRVLTLEELRELALSMGLSDREWSDLLLKAETSLNMALAHMKVQNYTDAIRAAEEAVAINPYIKDGNAILAQCYLKLAYLDNNKELFLKAEQSARLELKNDPLDGSALNVVSAVELQKQEGKSNNTVLKKVVLIALGILLLLVIGFLWMKGSNASTSTIKNEQSEMRLTVLSGEVSKAESLYFASIQRRNELALECVGSIKNGRLKEEMKDAAKAFDFKQISSSEQRFKLVWGDAKATKCFSDDDLVRMEGANNRMETEKKRYLEKASEFNSFVSNSQYSGNYKLFDIK